MHISFLGVILNFDSDCRQLRLQDTGISVRKRVIKIFRDVCIEMPNFDKIPDMCVKMIRRVNDEDSIKVSVIKYCGLELCTRVTQIGVVIVLHNMQ